MHCCLSGVLNPISGKVWNDVIRRAWVNLTRKCFRQYKYPKRPHIGHNLFLATYFDIFLAIESKISPKMSIFLMLLATIWEWSKLTFFKPKNIKSSYFEFQKSYILSVLYYKYWSYNVSEHHNFKPVLIIETNLCTDFYYKYWFWFLLLETSTYNRNWFKCWCWFLLLEISTYDRISTYDKIHSTFQIWCTTFV